MFSGSKFILPSVGSDISALVCWNLDQLGSCFVPVQRIDWAGEDCFREAVTAMEERFEESWYDPSCGENGDLRARNGWS